MLDIILAITPIFGLILFGCVLRRMDFPGPDFWPVSERLTYYVLFPAMLMHGLSGRQIQAGGFPIAGAIAGSVVLVFLGLRWLRPRLGMSGPAYTSVLQGSIRPNTYVAMSVAAGLLGPDWMALSAVALLTIIPLVNVLCVLALARHGNNAGGGLLKVLKELARNPLILSCVVGLAMNWGGWSLPPVVDNLFAILGTAALPMGLLAVGAGFRFDGVMDGGARAGGFLGSASRGSARAGRDHRPGAGRGCAGRAHGRDLHRHTRCRVRVHSGPADGRGPSAHGPDHHVSDPSFRRDPARGSHGAGLIWRWELSLFSEKPLVFG
ncbi:AEC family transporter [Pseudodesulfovibrio tunisiensis]|uniref:AEC family transporter n=1 Tax=Pseudodesulfovibrio tunisiensis TaxID=463192 RepID=UPI001FB4B6FD|nr:AEC family transporter [Pseudodesulfovibrio tunisiensis]